MHHKLSTLNDPAVELKLAKYCLGESKVQHLLRMYGTDLRPTLVDADRTIDMTLNRIATGITETGRHQAALGIHIGGLGLRRLHDIAVPAELAAKLTALPKVRELCNALSTAGLTEPGLLLNHLLTKIHTLQATLTAQLDQTEAAQLPDLIQQITKRTQQEWDSIRHGTPITAPQPTSPWQRLSLDHHENGQTAFTDPEDESPCTTSKAQHLLCQLTDNTRARLLYTDMQEQEATDDIERINELRRPQVHHQWTQHIDPTQGAVLPPDIYRDAIRHRLGCQFLPEATTCHCCGKLLDVQCVHAGCCATSEATRGHYAVVRAITAVAKTIDPTTSREETYGDARLRPGDVITNAVLDGRNMAIDVGVTSQAKRTQGDPIQDYQYKKINKYRHIIQNEFLLEGICFRAAIWTQEGRPGKDAIEVIEGLARQAEKILTGGTK